MKGCLGATLKIFAGLMVLAIVGIVYVLSGFYSIHVRYRLTVEMQDGDQIKTGSSIIDVAYDQEPDSISWSGPGGHVGPITGYAPTVDLGEKGLLFLTFENANRTPDQKRARNETLFCGMDDIACLPFAAYDKPGTNVVVRPFRQRAIELAELLRNSGPRDVPFAILPRFAWFSNRNDPQTHVEVSPFTVAATLGPGIDLKRVILDLTDDPVTPQPQTWPQWLKQNGQNWVGTLIGVKTP